jgi:transposase-like protein
MPRGIPATSPEIRAEILRKLKENGESVPDLAKQYGLGTKTIYRWVASNVTAPPSVLELSRLKRENANLHEIIGRLTVKLSQMEKKDMDR